MRAWAVVRIATVPAEQGYLLRDPWLKCCKTRVFEGEAGDLSFNEALQPL